MRDAGYVAAGFALTAGSLTVYLASLRTRLRRLERLHVVVTGRSRRGER